MGDRKCNITYKRREGLEEFEGGNVSPSGRVAGKPKEMMLTFEAALKGSYVLVMQRWGAGGRPCGRKKGDSCQEGSREGRLGGSVG